MWILCAENTRLFPNCTPLTTLPEAEVLGEGRLFPEKCIDSGIKIE
jgi:hypothetical protein